MTLYERALQQPEHLGDGVGGASESVTLDSSNLRYATGLSLFGLKAEIGGRGGNIAYAVGYGISF